MKKRACLNKLFLLLFGILILTSSVFAGDVAYIYRNPNIVNHNITNAFEGMGMSVDLISESKLPKDWKQYKLLYVGDESFRNSEMIPVGLIPTVVSNYYHTEVWGLTDRDGVSKLASNMPLRVNKDMKVIQVYNNIINNRGRPLSYYYIDNNNKVCEIAAQAAGVYTGETIVSIGDVIAYINQDTKLGNGKMSKANICFFGLVASDFWTTEAKNMFKKCVEFAKIKEVHDVGFVDFTNAVNKIRIENQNGSDILGNELQCNEKYKIGIKIANNGTFTENVNFMGMVGSVNFSHNAALDLAPGETSLKTKTINLTLTEGNYTMKIEAKIVGAQDSNPTDNIVERQIKIMCPVDP